MACRGVHFAISDDDLAKLLTARSDDELLQAIQEIEDRWDEQWLFQTDKGWEAIHRCFTNGGTDFGNIEEPLSLCILGGKQLHTADDYIVSLKTPMQVADIARAVHEITADALRRRYFAIPQNDYSQPLSEDDFEYVSESFKGLPEFFARAAAARRSVIFTVDQ